MRGRIAVALISVGTLVACGNDPIAAPTVDLKIVSLTPDNIFTEGGDLLTVIAENSCKKDQLVLEVAGLKIPAFDVDEANLNKITFSAPTAGNLAAASSVEVKITCGTHPTAGTTYAAGKNFATTTLRYDPNLEPQVTVKTYGPSGNNISVLAKMTVTFSRPMNPESVTGNPATSKPANIGIAGEGGTVTYDAPSKTATFSPTKQLDYDKIYNCFVNGGDAGVKTLGVAGSTPKNLLAKLKIGDGAIDPNKDQWSFHTRCEGCGNPWLGDISAAAGLSSGGGYNLFSVTGQPTPTGEAYAGTPESHTYKLQSGFIYATQPGGN